MKLIKLMSLVLVLVMVLPMALACQGGVDTTGAPDTTAAPDTTKSPDTTKAPDTTKSPDTTKTPGTTKAPETTKKPDAPTTPSGVVKVELGSNWSITPSEATVMEAWSGSYLLTNVFDDNTTTRFASKYVGRNGATGTIDDYWFVIDFGKEVTFDHLLDVDYKPSLWTKWEFATSADNKSWTAIDDAQVSFTTTPVEGVNNTHNVEFTFSKEVTTRYLKIKVIHEEVALTSGTVSIWELSFSKGSLLAAAPSDEIGEGYSAIADVTPEADGLVTDYGQPAILNPGSAYPDVKIVTYRDVTGAELQIVKDGKTLKTVSLGNLKAMKSDTYHIDGKAEEAGEYQIVVSMVAGGKTYEYVRYFTAVDTKQFGNGNTALAYKDASGKMVYVCDYMGNRMLDYSRVGYEEGKALPTEEYIASLPKVTVSPTSGDDGKTIQNAINSLRSTPINAQGYRGVVELAAGTYNCTTAFNLNVSGVILRGATGKAGDVVIEYPKGTFVKNSGDGTISVLDSTRTAVQGTYLPAGTTTLTVANASQFKVGDEVAVLKKVTADWVKYVGMDKLVRNGAPQTWIGVDTEIRHMRTIIAINGNTITLDTGVSDSFDSKYLGFPMATVAKVSSSGYINHTGIENLTIRYAGLNIDDNRNSWLRNMTVDYCATADGKVSNSIVFEGRAKYMTAKDCSVTHDRNDQTAAPADFTMKGTYLLLDSCTVPMYDQGGTWGYVYQSTNAGPHVVYNSVGAACPHQRWTTGILIDTVSIPKTSSSRPGVQFINRNTMGSGHGWTCGWSLAWNCTAPHFKMEAAPGTTNWAIGCVGSKLAPSFRGGLYMSLGTKIALGSLYEAQYAERTAK